MKKIIFVFLFTIQIIAQPDFNPDPRIIQAGKFYNSEIHFFASDNAYTIYYLYKISYSQLFFQKTGDRFEAELKVNLEIQDSLKGTIKRVFDDRKISTSDFELTNSENTFLQGLLKFDLEKGKYRVIAIISDGISKRERRIPPVDLEIEQANLFFSPIVIENTSAKFENSDWVILTNNSNSIAFNRTESDLLFPVKNDKLDSIFVSVKQGESYLVSNKVLKDFISCNSELKIADDFVGMKKNTDSSGIKCFIFNDLSGQLDEGPVQVEIKSGVNDKPAVFNMNVIWINKPISLIDPDQAIRFLELIEPRSTVSDILGGNGDDKTNLYEYWKAKDPTPHTKYNELMNEFYTRVDYCEKNFSGLSATGGAKSDRGKIYIRFGKPDSTDRFTNSEDNVVETWVYKNLNKTFHFLDKDGTGRFQLADEK